MNKVFVSFLFAGLLKGKQRHLQLTTSIFLFIIPLLDSKGIAFFIIGKRTSPKDFLFILLFTYAFINLIYYMLVVRKLSFSGVKTTEIEAAVDIKQQVSAESNTKFRVIPTTDYLEGNNSRSPKTSPKVTIKVKQSNNLPSENPTTKVQQPVIEQTTGSSGYTPEQTAKISKAKEKQKEIERCSKLSIDNPPPNGEPNREDLHASGYEDEPPDKVFSGIAIEPKEDIDDVVEIGVSDTKDNMLEQESGLLDDPNEVFNSETRKTGIMDFLS